MPILHRMTQARPNPQYNTVSLPGLAGIFFITLVYPLLSMLWRQAYPVLSAEVALFLVAMAFTALLLAALACASRAWLANTLLLLCMFLALLLQFNLLLEQGLALLATLALLAWAKQELFRRPALAVFTTLRMGGQDEPGPQAGAFMEDTPFVCLSGRLPLLRQDIVIFAQR